MRSSLGIKQAVLGLEGFFDEAEKQTPRRDDAVQTKLSARPTKSPIPSKKLNYADYLRLYCGNKRMASFWFNRWEVKKKK